MAGYRNLVKLSSLAYTEGFYSQAARRPRAARQVQRGDHRLVGVPGRRGRAAPHGRRPMAAAREAASWYAELFKDRYYLEVQAHESRGAGEAQRARLRARRGARTARHRDQRRALPQAPTITTRTTCCSASGSARIAATPTGCATIAASTSRARRRSRSTSRIGRTFSRTRSRSPTRSTSSSGRSTTCPAFPLPAGRRDRERPADDARDGGREGAVRRSAARRTCSERLDYELGVITKTGYAGYFLIVADFIKAARDRGIPVGPGRGSAAGSLVAYSLRITDV